MSRAAPRKRRFNRDGEHETIVEHIGFQRFASPAVSMRKAKFAIPRFPLYTASHIADRSFGGIVRRFLNLAVLFVNLAALAQYTDTHAIADLGGPQEFARRR